MASYGEIIEDYDPARELIYKYFTGYFRNPTMTKIKDTDKYSMYLTKLYCLLNRECRYIIVFTEKTDSPPGSLEELKNINWISFQTRTLSEQYNDVETHGYEPLAEGPLLARINRINITKEVSTYSCDSFPITVTLLHTEKNTPDTYQKSGTIINALETFQTIITFNNEPMEFQSVSEPSTSINNRTIINHDGYPSQFPLRQIPQTQFFDRNIQNQPRPSPGPIINHDGYPRQFPARQIPQTQFIDRNIQNQPRPPVINQNFHNQFPKENINQPYYPQMHNQPRPSHTRSSRIIKPDTKV